MRSYTADTPGGILGKTVLRNLSKKPICRYEVMVMNLINPGVSLYESNAREISADLENTSQNRAIPA